MRTLHIAAGNLYGGVETYLTTLAVCRSLCPQMEHAFAVCFEGRLRDELEAAGVVVHDLGPVQARRPWTVARARRRLGRILESDRPDAVVYHMTWALGLFGGVARAHGLSVVAHMHGPSSGGGWAEWLASRQRPDLLLAPSRHAADTWQRPFRDTRIEVLNYPLPPLVQGRSSERSILRASLGTSADAVVILQASRIEAWKGPDRTLHALARLRDVPGWRLWMAGGPQRHEECALYENLQRIAEEAGIAERVAFLGQRSDVPALMGAADIYCQGNRGPEGFGLTFLEAGFYSLPVVTTDLGGAAEVVDAATGILVPPGEDVTELSEALRCLITDADRRAALGAQAHERVIRSCDTGQQLRRLADLLAVVGGES
jgi:glycosyltransferase involved in cell wall biosynthesis